MFQEVKKLAKEFIEVFEDLVIRHYDDRQTQKASKERQAHKEKISKVIKALKRAKVYSKEEEVRDYGGMFGEKDHNR